MKKLMGSLLGTVVVFSLIVWIGFRWFGWKFNGDVNPVQLATLATNVLIALWIQLYFATRMADLRAEKNIIVDNLRAIISTHKRCRETVRECYSAKEVSAGRKLSILTQLRELSNDLENLEFVLKSSQCKGLNDKCPTLRALYIAYKESVTGKSFPAPYEVKDYLDQENKFRDLNHALLTFLLEANKYR